MSYEGKRISNWFKIVSLDILILKKQQFSKLRTIDQSQGNESYPTVAIKVTPRFCFKVKVWTMCKFSPPIGICTVSFKMNKHALISLLLAGEKQNKSFKICFSRENVIVLFLGIEI